MGRGAGLRESPGTAHRPAVGHPALVPGGAGRKFPGGDATPTGLAFDGANIWVANTNSNNVTKLRASDGANLGTFPAGAQSLAAWPSTAPTSGWSTVPGPTTVTKLRASDGANLGTFAVGSQPAAVTFDGANIWVANSGSGDVTKLRASDGTNLGTFAVGSYPAALAFDGANIWVANCRQQQRNQTAGQCTGADLGTFAVDKPMGPGLRRRQYLGDQLQLTNSVARLRAKDGKEPENLCGRGHPAGRGFRRRLYLGEPTMATTTLTKLQASNGANSGEPSPWGPAPQALAFDGAHLW